LVQQLSEKSFVDKDEVRKIFNIINMITVSKSIKQITLIELNNLIETFIQKQVCMENNMMNRTDLSELKDSVEKVKAEIRK